MAKKTYRTYSLKSLLLMLKDENGERIEIKFYGGIQVDSTAKFTTKNEKIQAMLEKSSGFGRDYYIESVVEDAPAPDRKEEKSMETASAPKEEKKPVMDEMKGSERFRNLVEMKNRMKELGIEIEKDANYAKTKAAAIAAGYDFQIQR